jgi:hypothetical protein
MGIHRQPHQPLGGAAQRDHRQALPEDFPPAFSSGKPTSAAELPNHLTASKWARCAAIKGESQVPVPTAVWSRNPSEQFATPNDAACFNTGCAQRRTVVGS